MSDPTVEKGWRDHHKRMSTDREFLDWAPTWRSHDRLLCSHFMLKPFILDPSSAIYEKQFERCKLNQASLSSRRSSSEYMRSASGSSDTLKVPSSNLHPHASSLPNSPRYHPYPKPPTAVAALDGSFRPSSDTSFPCMHCGHKGHRASECSAKHANRPERPLIVQWSRNRLESLDGKHVCLIFNARGTCSSTPSDRHGDHSCSLCGNSGHGAKDCTRN